MALIVHKYGGTSMGSPERIRNVARRVAKWARAGHQMVVVPSAMSGETNRLLALAKDLAPDKPSDAYSRELDMLAATGEQASSALLAIALQAEGMESVSYAGWQVPIRTNSAYTKARIESIDDKRVRADLATGKVVIDMATLPVDLMSMSSHKTYGPKGQGALYVRRKPRIRLEAQIHGGGHERGFRSGTLATHQIVGMGEAFRVAKLEMATENERIRMLRDRLYNGLKDIPEVFINGDMEQRVPHNLNISFNYVEGESLIMGVKGLAVSSGSACTSASLEPSYVLRALGRSDELAHSSLRMTIGRYTTEEEIDYAIATIKQNVAKLRDLSPLWEMYQDGVDISTIQWAAH